MNILSVVTNENPSSIALSMQGSGTQYIFPDGKKVAETIGENLRIICGFLGSKVKDIDTVAVISGPGSYTGLRVGMAFAKAFVQFSDKKLFAVDAFEVLKYKNAKLGEKLILPVLDARGGRAYIKENGKFFAENLENIEKKYSDHFLVGSALANGTDRELSDQDILYAVDLQEYVLENIQNLKNYNESEELLIKLLPIYVQEARIG